MSPRQRPLEASWSAHEGADCLRVVGSSIDALGAGPRAATAASGPDWLSQVLAVFPVFADGPVPADFPAMAGEFLLADDGLCFRPRHAFLPGQEYELRVLAPPAGPASVRITRPRPVAADRAEVLAIFPTAAELPRNHLRFYLQFSAPMSEGQAATAVTLRRASDDHVLPDVLLAMEPELWDRERTRLTLLLDPGRIKRGLAPQLEAGYPLSAGQDVVLEVADTFADAGGAPLQSPAYRRYRIGPDVRRVVSVSDWTLAPPTAGSTEPLVLRFDRPLDQALARRCLTVQDERRRPVAGMSTLGEGERDWVYIPDQPWAEGDYTLSVNPVLEDLAGNSLRRVFDLDLTRPEDAPGSTAPTVLPFRCS
ncbi:MAG: hypothetical protein JWO63_1322 [Frankiales bacterium]|nr:hypothetical protein [Frankiales bacterium]